MSETQTRSWNPFRSRKTDELARQSMQRPTTSNDMTGRKISVSGTDDAKLEVNKAPGLETWQKLVLHYLDRVPIASAAARYYESASSRIKYTLVDEATGDEAVGISEASTIIDILNAHHEELSRAVGLRFAIGESRHTFDPDDMVLTTKGAGELYWKGTGYVIEDRGGKTEDLDDNLIAWRSYDQDRKWSDLATSSNKAMLDVLESLVIVYAEDRARSIRLAMNTGIVLVDEALFSPDMEDVDDLNSEGSGQGAALEKRFAEMLQMTIQDPRQSASFVPPVIAASSEGGDVSKMIAHVPFAQERDKAAIKERIETLKEEYSVGVDLPADVAKGFLADMNHWNGEIVDEQAYKNYIGPKVEATVRDAFEEIAQTLEIDITGLTVGLDASLLISPADMSDTALKAYEDKIISAAAARKYIGMSEADAPTTMELEERARIETLANLPAPAPTSDVTTTDSTSDGEVGGGSGEGVVAAAGTDAKDVDLSKLSNSVGRARYQMENELRSAIQDYINTHADDDSVAAAGGLDPIANIVSHISGILMGGYKGTSLAAARALTTKRASSWYDNHKGRLEKQTDKAGLAARDLMTSLLKSKKATAITSNDVWSIARSTESVGAGGPVSMTTTGAPTGARPKAIVEDSDFVQLIRDEASAAPVYEWEHGSPPKPFSPHEDLDGTSWTSDEESSVLSNPNDFPKSSIYFPGDHEGCTCRYDVSFERI